MTKRERIALTASLPACVLAALWILWQSAGCTNPTDGGGESPGGTLSGGHKTDATDSASQVSAPAQPAVHLEPNTGTHIPMRVIPLAAETPPHACQPSIMGVCYTCAANKNRRAVRDTTGTYNPWSFNIYMPGMFGQRGRQQ